MQRNGEGDLSFPPAGWGPADGQEKARPIFLKKLQQCITADSVLLLEEANIKGR